MLAEVVDAHRLEGASADVQREPGALRTACGDALVTNFHLPKSTLLMLVAAFAGLDSMRRAYAHAVEQRYRFFSYGDAMFITRRNESENDAI